MAVVWVSGNKTVDRAVKKPHLLRMQTIEHLIYLADAYKTATGISEDTTVSYRVFGDSKKLAAIRDGRDITLRRFNAAMKWFCENWPEGVDMPGLDQPSQKAS